MGERLFPQFRYRWFAEELRENIPKELDFTVEVENARRASHHLRNMRNMVIPYTVDEYCNVLYII